MSHLTKLLTSCFTLEARQSHIQSLEGPCFVLHSGLCWAKTDGHFLTNEECGHSCELPPPPPLHWSGPWHAQSTGLSRVGATAGSSVLQASPECPRDTGAPTLRVNRGKQTPREPTLPVVRQSRADTWGPPRQGAWWLRFAQVMPTGGSAPKGAKGQHARPSSCSVLCHHEAFRADRPGRHIRGSWPGNSTTLRRPDGGRSPSLATPTPTVSRHLPGRPGPRSWAARMVKP